MPDNISHSHTAAAVISNVSEIIGLGLAAIKWFLTAFETLNLLTYLLTFKVIFNHFVANF